MKPQCSSGNVIDVLGFGISFFLLVLLLMFHLLYLRIFVSLQAHVVAAFEQSLSNMTARLQHLTSTAEQKVRESLIYMYTCSDKVIRSWSTFESSVLCILQIL